MEEAPWFQVTPETTGLLLLIVHPLILRFADPDLQSGSCWPSVSDALLYHHKSVSPNKQHLKR